MTITVDFEEHEDSPIERGDRNSGFSFSRIFLTAYADRFTFLNQMFTTGTAGFPKSYHTAFPNLRCQSFDIERITNRPTGPATITNPETQIIGHNTLAKITIEYGPLDTTFQAGVGTSYPGTWLTYSRASTIEFVDFSHRSLVWEGTDPVRSLPADFRPTVPITTTRHELVWHYVSSPPWALLQSLKGSVNSVEFPIPVINRAVPIDHLLFLEDSSRTVVKFDGSIATELTLTFLEKNQGFLSTGTTYGWNHKLDPGEDPAADPAFRRPVTAGTGDPMFRSANLLSIFA